jgi:hypothetical protein
MTDILVTVLNASAMALFVTLGVLFWLGPVRLRARSRKR